MRARRVLGIGAAALVLSCIGIWVERAPIGMALFRRAVEQNLGTDRAAALPDGIHVYLCGSGSPLPDNQRAGPCVGVLAGRDAFVFDTGSGSVRKLLRMGFPVEKLQSAFLTHLHSDHIDGLGELLLQAWVGGGRAAPLPVGGPVGTARVVAGFDEAYAIDNGYRIAHHGPKIANPTGAGAVAREITIPDGLPGTLPVWQGDGVTITAIRVDHRPVVPALGYRIDYKGRSVAISGDTVATQGFASAAKGSDVILHEAMNKDMVAVMGETLARHGRVGAAQIMHDIQGYHASPADAAGVAQTAGAKLLVLTHLVPPLPSRFFDAAFLGDARSKFGGPIVVGRDGLLISLPAGSERVDQRDAL